MRSRLLVCLVHLSIIFSTRLFVARAQELRLLSRVDPTNAASGGSSGSYNPILTPDGRFVVFSSTANNLLLTSNGSPIRPLVPTSLNIYLRDRLTGTNTLISVNLSRISGGNGDSTPSAVSPDGRYVLFESLASDLVPNDTNGLSDVFLRDLQNSQTILISAGTNGAPGRGASRSPVMTPDARSVAFVSAAPDLISGDTNQIPDVFVRDVTNGVTRLASVGAFSPNLTGTSEAPDITADGRYVAFYSTATGMVTVASNRFFSDIFIRDFQANTTILASAYSRIAVNSNYAACFNHAFSADGSSLVYEASGGPSQPATFLPSLYGTVMRYNLASGQTDIVGTNATVPRAAFEDIRSLDISADGRFIAYVANQYTNDGSTTCINFWDAQTGLSTIVSGNLDSGNVPTNSFCDWPFLDPTGRYLAFLSSATNMVTNAAAATIHLYLQDLQNGTRQIIDSVPNDTSAGVSCATIPRVSSDARFVVFEANDSKLVPQDRNRAPDVFLKDLQTGAVELISAHDPALLSLTPNGISSITQNSVSYDGQYVAFASDADNLVANDTNGFRDVFLLDSADGSLRLVSVDTNGAPADGVSSEPAVSGDGRFVAFTSLADNLVTGDTNRVRDVFVRDLQLGLTTLVSVNVSGTGPGALASYQPAISSDGRFVLFRSQARNLTSDSFVSTENLFLRDLQQGKTFAVTTSGASATAAMTPDGRYVVCTDNGALTSGAYYVFDALAGTRATNTAGSSVGNFAISADGQTIAFTTSGGIGSLWAANRQTGLKQLIATTTIQFSSPVFSANGNVLVYCQVVSNIRQVMYYDFLSGVRTTASIGPPPSAPAGNDHSDSPTVSPDGRFIIYRSAATNLVPGDLNRQPDIFIFDRQSGTNMCLTVNGSQTANHRSLLPIFSRDGSRLVFLSWASDLTGGDFNSGTDLFSFTFLVASIYPGVFPPLITWPWLDGKNYTIEYKDNPGDAAWHELAGTVVRFGVTGLAPDASANGTLRVYRVKAF